MSPFDQGRSAARNGKPKSANPFNHPDRQPAGTMNWERKASEWDEGWGSYDEKYEAELRSERASKAAQARWKKAKIFDIRDGRNVYEPCPKCRTTFGMGLTSRGGGSSGNERGRLFVYCDRCGHEGPSIEVPTAAEYRNWPISWDQRDRLAFEAWNDESRAATQLSQPPQ